MILRHDMARTRVAEFSECEMYRYRLRYCFDGDAMAPPVRPVVFLMLNPSTATELAPDPTVRRCMGFAKTWGHSDLLVVNLFALRSTDPDELLRVEDPVGPENDDVLSRLPASAPIICAWGAHKIAKARADAVTRLLDRPLFSLRLTKTGAPQHPLYLPAGLRPQPYQQVNLAKESA